MNGERGRVRELWDLGERTVEGGRFLRDAVRVALVLAVTVVVVVVVVLVRFLGFARSCCWDGGACEGWFSLSAASSVEMWSL